MFHSSSNSQDEGFPLTKNTPGPNDLTATLPETNIALKMMVSNRNLLFQGSIFRGYFSFRECSTWNTCTQKWLKKNLVQALATELDFRDLRILHLFWENCHVTNCRDDLSKIYKCSSDIKVTWWVANLLVTSSNLNQNTRLKLATVLHQLQQFCPVIPSQKETKPSKCPLHSNKLLLVFGLFRFIACAPAFFFCEPCYLQDAQDFLGHKVAMIDTPNLVKRRGSG